ncbi:hypothetical protein MtrunA17_Chr8g0366781 [Medicago truncatula]|uniref:VQ domain-containing protein n=1 Tax=Medicago truncatula TaxID=3880 RepID=G7LHR4_MEDTR|nr:protein HAIKU1 [Medicago truncatula]AET03298.1 hypothetical protein MTR_8g067310 [Medicago truncatula]RHN41504.1 hypothetical protein MtrunA17_Chr8g0366781 [Medicago truncatula]
MEKSKNHWNKKFGVNKMGNKNIRNSHLQHAINIGITSGKHNYLKPKVYHIHKDDFKSFIQHVTGKQSNELKSMVETTRLDKIRPPPLSIARPLVPIHVSAPTFVAPPQVSYNPLSEPLKPIIDPPLVDMSCNNFLESPISAFMRNFQDSTMNQNTSRCNQFQPYPPQTQVLNNVNVDSTQHYPIETQMVTSVETFAESPISAYMRSFQNSMLDYGTLGGNQFQPQPNYCPQMFI